MDKDVVCGIIKTMSRVFNIILFLLLIPATLAVAGFLQRTFEIIPLAHDESALLNPLFLGAIFTPLSIILVTTTMLILYLLQRRFKWTGSKPYTMLFFIYILVLIVGFTLFFVWIKTGSS